MTKKQAKNVKVGDTVKYFQTLYTVSKIIQDLPDASDRDRIPFPLFEMTNGDRVTYRALKTV